MFDNDIKPVITINSTRGCPFACMFCGVANTKFRGIDADRLVSYISDLKSKYGLRDFDEPPFENIKKEKSFTKIPALLKSSIANSNPEFLSATSDSVYEDSTYLFNVLTNDPDANSVTVSVASNPSWLSLTAKSGGTINDITLRWPTPLESGAKATETVIGSPTGMAFDSNGNLYFSDDVNATIYKIDTNGE